MADVELNIIDLPTGKSVGKFLLTLCEPKMYELDTGNYCFRLRHLITDEVQEANRVIIEGGNLPLEFIFTAPVIPPIINKNLAVIPDDWGDYAGNIIYNGDPQICFLDHNVVRTAGKPSIRLEPHREGIDPNVSRECDGKWYPVKPGDRIVAKCWMKTGNSSTGKNGSYWYGARIGLDLYGPRGDGTITILEAYPPEAMYPDEIYVPWGTPNWTLRTYDFIIPSTIYTKDNYGKTIPPTPVTQIVMWVQALPLEDAGHAWFADTELYINPTPAPPIVHTLIIATTAGGITNPEPSSYECIENTTVKVAAVPDKGYNFNHWTLDGIEYTTNPISIIMSKNHELTAYFSEVPPPPIYHTLIIAVTTGGTTYPTPGRYNCIEGSSVVVTAIPSAGYRFVEWEIDGTIRTENPTAVIMDRDYSLRAVFELIPAPPPERRYLTIVTINSQTNPAQGTYEYTLNSEVVVTVTPYNGYKFKEWLLDGVHVGVQPFITVIMDANHTLEALSEKEVIPLTYKLTIVTTTGGVTTPAPGVYEYEAGVIITVTAVPHEGYTFKRFEHNGEVKMQNPINVVMGADHTLLAVFEATPPPISPSMVLLLLLTLSGSIGAVAIAKKGGG